MKYPITHITRRKEVLDINIATAQELQECSEFVRRNFFPVAPLNLITVCDDSQDLNFVDELLTNCILSGVSLVVRNQQREIVAVRMSELFSEGRPSKLLDVNRIDFAILKTLNENVDLFALFNTAKLFHFVLMAVDQRFGRLGLAATLLNLSIELAKSTGAGAVVMEAVNSYAAKAAIKNGLRVINTVDYAAFEFGGKFPLAGKRELLAEHSKAYLLARALP